MIKDDKYKIDISISERKYECKTLITWNKVTYRNNLVTLDELVKLISEGRCFCYNFNSSILTQKQKTIENFKYTNVIFIDIDDIEIEMNDFIDKLNHKPTIAYTTFNDRQGNHRFRLIYCFNQPITTVEQYKKMYLSIIKHLEESNQFKNKDNCAISPNQQFYGNGCSPKMYTSFVVYEQCELLDSSIELNKNKHHHSPPTTKENECEWTLTITDEDYINDFNSMRVGDLLMKYREKYPFIEQTPLEQVDDDVAYIMLPKNYIEVKRYWIKEEMYNQYGEAVGVNAKPLKIKDGQQRRKKLFINGILRRMMIPNITFEHMLHNLVNEVYYYVDNTIDSITRRDLYNITCNVFKANVDDYSHMIPIDSRKWIVNPKYCIKHNVSRRSARNIAKKQITYHSILELYDSSKTDKDNLKILNDNGVDISLRTLKNFKKENGFSKVRKQDVILNSNILMIGDYYHEAIRNVS